MALLHNESLNDGPYRAPEPVQAAPTPPSLSAIQDACGQAVALEDRANRLQAVAATKHLEAADAQRACDDARADLMRAEAKANQLIGLRARGLGL